jgi:hypothetical protein
LFFFLEGSPFGMPLLGPAWTVQSLTNGLILAVLLLGFANLFQAHALPNPPQSSVHGCRGVGLKG